MECEIEFKLIRVKSCFTSSTFFMRHIRRSFTLKLRELLHRVTHWYSNLFFSEVDDPLVGSLPFCSVWVISIVCTEIFKTLHSDIKLSLILIFNVFILFDIILFVLCLTDVIMWLFTSYLYISVFTLNAFIHHITFLKFRKFPFSNARLSNHFFYQPNNAIKSGFLIDRNIYESVNVCEFLYRLAFDFYCCQLPEIMMCS